MDAPEQARIIIAEAPKPVLTPEVSAALSDLKKSVGKETVLGAIGGAATGFEALDEMEARNPAIAVAATLGAAAGAGLGRYDANHWNQKLDAIANNPDSAGRDAELAKEKRPLKPYTQLGAAGGGVLGGAFAYAATHSKPIGTGGKIAIITGSIALGAVALGGYSHHYYDKQNRQIDALSEALDRRDASGHVQKLLQQSETTAGVAQTGRS